MLVFVLYVLALGIPVVSVSDYNGLKFGNDGYSIISFQPNMASLSEKFTFCVWVRTKTSESTHQMPFAYEQGELFIDSIRTRSGRSSSYRLFGSYGSISSEHTPEMGTWYQYCGSWSLASRTFRAYVNGKLAGTLITAAGRKLKTGGTFVLGDYWDTVATSQRTSGTLFGSEMFNLNLYSKELTSTEIAALSADGLCTPLPDQLDEYRVIRWEEVLELPRHGTVQDIQTGCGDFELEKTQRLLQEAINEKEDLQASLRSSQAELLEVKGQHDTTIEELQEVKETMLTNKNELNNIKIEFEKTQRLLQESLSEKEDLQSSLSSSQAELLEVKGQRDSTIEELQEVKDTILTNENELNNIKIELRNVSLKLNGTQIELVNARIELGESNVVLKNTTIELNETKSVLENLRLELNLSKFVLERSLLELNETKLELRNTKLELGMKTALEGECELQKGHENELNNIKSELASTQRLLQEYLSEKEELQLSLRSTQAELVEAKRQRDSIIEELQEVKETMLTNENELNETKSVLENSRLELNLSKVVLERSLLELNETKLELRNTKLELDMKTALEGECELQKGHLTKWDALYSCPFYNKVFTRKLHKQLRTTWGSLNTKILIGRTITDEVIALIKNLEEDNTCTDV